MVLQAGRRYRNASSVPPLSLAFSSFFSPSSLDCLFLSRVKRALLFSSSSSALSSLLR